MTQNYRRSADLILRSSTSWILLKALIFPLSIVPCAVFALIQSHPAGTLSLAQITHQISNYSTRTIMARLTCSSERTWKARDSPASFWKLQKNAWSNNMWFNTSAKRCTTLCELDRNAWMYLMTASAVVEPAVHLRFLAPITAGSLRVKASSTWENDLSWPIGSGIICLDWGSKDFYVTWFYNVYIKCWVFTSKAEFSFKK